MEIQSSLSEIFLSPRGGILSHEEYINHYTKGKVKFNDKFNDSYLEERAINAFDNFDKKIEQL